MRISIFGLGYVGCVSIGCFANEGFPTIGVDINRNKIDLINSGKATIIENGLDDLINKGVERKLIEATNNSEYAVTESDVGIICVGTPNTNTGHLNTQQIFAVAKEIGNALKSKKEFFTITIRSTVPPGTNRAVSKIISELSGRREDIDFAVISNPEFLREGSAIEDFYSPPYTVVGGSSVQGIKIVEDIFSFISAPLYKVEIEIAEMIKFINNSFHALKVVFANEIGRLCKSMNINSYELMNLFAEDSILNISKKYFKPGFSYGGSCLPKDLKALNLLAHDYYVNVPILEAINNSNIVQTDFIYNLIISKNVKKIGVFGLSFKTDTDDLRFSPSLELCERLIGKGFSVTIYDENVNISRLVGKNKEFLINHLPHIDSLLTEDLNEFVANNDLLIFVHDSHLISEVKSAIKEDAFIIDVANITSLHDLQNYEGACW
ncbi:MAG: nucleotide sugar dehydrogenase [Firmicutes bacterium]|nr:nucleotide sugar dehydrogenase [Bacillota bacterium]